MVYFLNCFTCNLRFSRRWKSGTLCLLVETDQGPVLVDTGLGTEDYRRPPVILRVFQVLTHVPLRREEAAVHQIAGLGYRREDIRHIVLTHLHFDHCGGLPDFPHAKVHVNRKEHEAFFRRPRRWSDGGYVRRHTAHQPVWVLHHAAGERWFDFEAIRLPFEPEMWMVPLYGHTPGHSGVAVRTGEGWLFHVADSAGIELTHRTPEWLVRLFLGPHQPRLRRFAAAHPEVRLTTGHMWLSSFGEPHLASETP
jgi:glyoxylase-like metal-dependent hydrolase (beta-lactamase superfamily II)